MLSEQQDEKSPKGLIESLVKGAWPCFLSEIESVKGKKATREQSMLNEESDYRFCLQNLAEFEVRRLNSSRFLSDQLLRPRKMSQQQEHFESYELYKDLQNCQKFNGKFIHLLYGRLFKSQEQDHSSNHIQADFQNKVRSLIENDFQKTTEQIFEWKREESTTQNCRLSNSAKLQELLGEKMMNIGSLIQKTKWDQSILRSIKRAQQMFFLSYQSFTMDEKSIEQRFIEECQRLIKQKGFLPEEDGQSLDSVWKTNFVEKQLEIVRKRKVTGKVIYHFEEKSKHLKQTHLAKMCLETKIEFKILTSRVKSKSIRAVQVQQEGSQMQQMQKNPSVKKPIQQKFNLQHQKKQTSLIERQFAQKLNRFQKGDSNLQLGRHLQNKIEGLPNIGKNRPKQIRYSGLKEESNIQSKDQQFSLKQADASDEKINKQLEEFMFSKQQIAMRQKQNKRVEDFTQFEKIKKLNTNERMIRYQSQQHEALQNWHSVISKQPNPNVKRKFFDQNSPEYGQGIRLIPERQQTAKKGRKMEKIQNQIEQITKDREAIQHRRLYPMKAGNLIIQSQHQAYLLYIAENESLRNILVRYLIDSMRFGINEVRVQVEENLSEINKKSAFAKAKEIVKILCSVGARVSICLSKLVPDSVYDQRVASELMIYNYLSGMSFPRVIEVLDLESQYEGHQTIGIDS